MLELLCLLLLQYSNGHPLQDTALGLNEILWSPEASRVYIGSPSIVQPAPGLWLTSADRFGSGFHGLWNASIYSSEDGGVSWQFLSWVPDHYWSNLFLSPTAVPPRQGCAIVYLLGTSKPGGDVRISSSTDCGHSWTSATVVKGQFATGPTPVAFHASSRRLFRCIEGDHPSNGWPEDFTATAVYATLPSLAQTSDPLLDPTNWQEVPEVPFNSSWLPSSWPKLSRPGFLEGNCVLTPTGELYNVLRLNSEPVEGNYAIVLKLDPTAPKPVFEFVDLISLPGGHSKFVIRRDPRSGLYLTLSNNNTDAQYQDQRNVLVLCSSPDLLHWTIRHTVLMDDTGFEYADSVRYTGFHYVDWRFDGDDLVLAVRTAYRGAVSYHNSNRMTVTRVKKYGQYL